MKTLSVTEARRRLGALLNDAQQQPVLVRRQGHDIAVVLSIVEYERLRPGNVQAFLDLRKAAAGTAVANGLTEDRLRELLRDDS